MTVITARRRHGSCEDSPAAFMEPCRLLSARPTKPEQHMSLKRYVKTIGATVASVTAALWLAGCGNEARDIGQIVFTADEQGRSISVVNPATGQVETTSIPVSPHNVQVSSDGRSLFAVGSSSNVDQHGDAAMMGSGRLLIFDASAVSQGPRTNISVGRMPAHVIVDSRNERAFVTSAGDNMLTVVDLGSGTVDRNIAVGRSPHGLRMSPDGRTIYVANTGDGTVSVVNVANLAERERIPVGRGPVQVAFTPDGRFSYVTLRDENGTAVIDTASRRVVATIPVGPGPIQVFASPDGREVYVANQGTEARPGNTVSVIDTARQTVVATIITGAGAHGVAVSGSGDRVFIANSFADTVSVLDPRTRRLVRNIPVGRGPGGISVAEVND